MKIAIDARYIGKSGIGRVIEGILDNLPYDKNEYYLIGPKKLEEKYKVELPIIDIVYEVLVNGKDVKTAIVSLFSRAKKSEI